MQIRTSLLALAFASLGVPAFAQYTSGPTAYSFVDISSTGTSLGLSGLDDAGATLPIGFGFTFYGSVVSSISATTNGYMTTGTDLTDFTPDCPAPSDIDPNGVIAPFFEDLSCVAHGELYYQTLGASPTQVAVIQWEDVSTFDSSLASLTFQVQLFENGSIQYHYESLQDTSGVYPVLGDLAFIGVESADGLSAETVACGAGAPVLSPMSAIAIDPVLPFIAAPSQVVSGTSFNVTGAAEPGTFYVFAWANTAGPFGPIPLLEGITLDLDFNFKLAGAGITGAGGTIASDTLVAPLGFNFTQIFWQAITISSFGPIAGVSKSNSEDTILRDGVILNGSINSAGVADTYEFPASIGDIISIRHCRTDNTGTGTGTLDPFVCLVAPSGVVAAFDDESAGACLVPGPFGASEIVNFVSLENGTWKCVASSYQGLGDETGTYELTLIAPGAQAATLTLDEGPVCPGQFNNPVTKMLQTLEPQRQRRR